MTNHIKYIAALSFFLPISFSSQAGNNIEIKDAGKAVFNIITYKADGSILHSGHGIFISNTGEGLSLYSFFENASRAEVIDSKGTKYPVFRILGASSTNDLVRFSITGGKKISYFDLADAATADTTSNLNLISYSTEKKNKPIRVKVTSADTYDSLKYYTTTVTNTPSYMGCPIATDEGRIVGITQTNVEKNAKGACAIDARFALNLTVGKMGGLNSDLRNIDIPKAIPANEKDALTYLYLISSADSATYMTALNDFISQFPENAEGYANRAKYYSQLKQYAMADQDFAKAAEVVKEGKSTIKADEIHNDYSKTIYQKAVYAPKDDYSSWTLEKALDEARKAYAISPNPFYLLQEGRCLFSMKKYKEAHQSFLNLAQSADRDSSQWSPTAKSEAWFYAARSLELANGDSLQVIALMDSAINRLPQPLDQSTAQYLFERATRLVRAGKFRLAVKDYTNYEQIIGPSNLTAQFYYLKEQAELNSRMYQQALDDIRTALSKAPNDELYMVEEALVLLRAGLYEEAAKQCEKTIASYPNNSDAYKIMGLSYGELKQKAKAISYLKKAKELGDKTAESFMERYLK